MHITIDGDRVTIDGRAYIPEDSVGGRRDVPLTVREACERYGLHPSTLYDAIRDGRLRASVPNGCTRGTRLWESDLLDWMGVHQP